jgi:UDP-N-acetylglucosamine/UDP-N-acetyl-alpha-D-glucosaminouronate 4-epimerase
VSVGPIGPEDRCLVTGGAGFVGSNLVEHLVGEGASIRVLDNFSTGKRENLDGVRDQIELVEASITDAYACREACDGVDYVFHQAALPSIPRSIRNPLATHEACATGTLLMLEAAREAGVRRFVYAGSSSAYGETAVLPKAEDMHEGPLSPYATAKLCGEHYCVVHHRVHGLETVVLRYFNVFGPRQDPKSQYSGVIPLFVRHALAGESPTVYGDGAQTRDFTYVDNVVGANVLAATTASEGVAGEVFNVGCGDRISVKLLWQEIREIVGTGVEAVHAEARAGEVRDSLASLEKIRERMGYEAHVSLREGLEKTIEWMRSDRRL